ncbi:sugar phosphate isomerase/epimerase, partial [Listeria monocytogenes]|nr:sugar phosphate isomerase/epimerase [Listeria monocytogenes]
MKAKIALQLWSVKEACEDDFFGTLEKVAEMGYDGVEFAGYYGKSASEIKAKLAELGLEVAGSH